MIYYMADANCIEFGKGAVIPLGLHMRYEQIRTPEKSC